jgi:hypothetical protein
MRSRHIAGLLVVAAALFPFSALTAQSRPIELGTDLGVAFDFAGGETMTTVSLPTAVLRVGFWMNDRISIEPNVNFTWVHIDGGSSTNVNGALALLYHFKTDVTRTRPYITVFPGINHFDSDFGDATQFFAGGGLGVLVPMQERLAFRAEALYSHNFESDDVGGFDEVAARFGFSFFTH